MSYHDILKNRLLRTGLFSSITNHGAPHIRLNAPTRRIFFNEALDLSTNHMSLADQDHRHFLAAEGWLELSNIQECYNELEEIDVWGGAPLSPLRRSPAP